MKLKITYLMVAMSLLCGAAMQAQNIIMTAGNNYYFQLANPGSLDALGLWQTAGFEAGLNPSVSDDLFFPTRAGGLTTIYRYNDGVNAGWLNQAFVQVFNTPNAFLIVSKRAGSMVWGMPAGALYYGSDLEASTNWLNAFKASPLVRPSVLLPARRVRIVEAR